MLQNLQARNYFKLNKPLKFMWVRGMVVNQMLIVFKSSDELETSNILGVSGAEISSRDGAADQINTIDSALELVVSETSNYRCYRIEFLQP